MPRSLKVFKTHIGFFDLVVAAPSQKAAVAAWHASPAPVFARLCRNHERGRRGVAVLAAPGQVLKRPARQAHAFTRPNLTPGGAKADGAAKTGRRRRQGAQAEGSGAKARPRPPLKGRKPGSNWPGWRARKRPCSNGGGAAQTAARPEPRIPGLVAGRRMRFRSAASPRAEGEVLEASTSTSTSGPPRPGRRRRRGRQAATQTSMSLK